MLTTRAPKTDWAELLPEVEWLLEGGVSPLLIPSIIGKSAQNIEKAAYRRGLPWYQLFANKKGNK